MTQQPKPLPIFQDIIRYVSRNEKKIYLISAAFILFLLILTGFNLANVQKIFAFFIFVVIGAFFKYIITRYKIWLEFTPVPFFCVIIAKQMGLFWVLPYILIADIMTMFAAGQGPTGGSVPYWIWMFIFSLISLAIPLNSFGIFFLPIFYLVMSLLIDEFMRGGLHAWRLASHFASFVINFYFFWKLSLFFTGIAG